MEFRDNDSEGLVTVVSCLTWLAWILKEYIKPDASGTITLGGECTVFLDFVIPICYFCWYFPAILCQSPEV